MGDALGRCHRVDDLPVVAEEGGVSYLVRSEPAATEVLEAFVAGQPLAQ